MKMTNFSIGNSKIARWKRSKAKKSVKFQELMRTGGTEILIVKGAEKEYLIPFAETICVEVDIENKLIPR